MGKSISEQIRPRRVPLNGYEAMQYLKILEDNGIHDGEVFEPGRRARQHRESFNVFYRATNIQQQLLDDELAQFREQSHAEALELNERLNTATINDIAKEN